MTRCFLVSFLVVVGCSQPVEQSSAPEPASEPRSEVEVGRVQLVAPQAEKSAQEPETVPARQAMGQGLQPPVPASEVHDSLDLLLAQIGVSERDLDVSETARRERFALWHVLVKRRDVLRRTDEDATLTDAVHAYSDNRLVKECEHQRQCWIQQLDEWGSEPSDWNRGQWKTRWRPIWLEYLREARAFLRGVVPDPCPRARHWGGKNIDPPKGRMKQVCKHLKTSNRLYAVEGRES